MFSKTGSLVRKISLAILVALLGGLQVPAASASSPVPDDGYYDCATGSNQNVSDSNRYTIHNGEAHNINCSGPVVLPEGVTSIGDQGFAYSGLTSINIPSSLKTISDYAFVQSSLASITIDEGLTSIGRQVFQSTPLASISLPSTITDLGAYLFSGSAITSVTLPEGLTSIGDGTFGGANQLASFTIPQSVTSIGAYAFYDTGLTSITIPDGVTSIGASAFYDTALTSITIPDSVTVIGASAFANTALTSLNIPAGVAGIGGGLVRGVKTLTSITVDPANQNYTAPDGVLHDKNLTRLIAYPAGKIESSYSIKDTVEAIREYAFSGATALATVNIPSSVTNIGDGAFYGATALAHADIPAGVTTIADDTFGYTALTNVTIPSGVTSIGQSAFRYATALSTVNIPSSVTNIGDGAFYGAAALTSITIPSGVTYIGEDTFGRTGLTSLTLPAGLTSIGYGAFYKVTALTSIVIPASVTYIDDCAFDQATSLMDVTFLGDVPSEYFGDNVFYNFPEGAKVHISSAAKGFGTDPTWNGLIVKVSYVVNYDAAGGTNVSSGVFEGGGAIQAAPVSTRAGYNLRGWSATENGVAVTFPYTPTATGDITLHAIWAQAAVKPSYVSGAKLTGTAKVGKSITASKGTWSGTSSIAYTYQWYLCKAASSKVLTTGNAGAKCTIVKNAKAASFKATVKEKGGYLAALITATNSAGKSTIFTSTTGKVS